MKSSWLPVFVLALGVIAPIRAVDYCATSFCNAGVPNVGCKPPVPPSFGVNCTGLTPKDVPLSATDITYILNQHNSRRQTLASGALPGYASATKMPTLVWDTELASQALNNARSCLYGHDKCRNTDPFRWAGQNIARMKYYGSTYTLSQLIDSFVASWWDEYKNANQGYLDAYPASYTGPAIGHFTQIASDRTWKIGCAMMNWFDNPWIIYYFVCDYSFTNIIGQATYKKGPVASACTKTPVASYPALCNIGEPINSVP